MVDEEGKDSENSDEPITHINFDSSSRTLQPEECDFSGHTFQGKANFVGTQFTGHANFEGATFKNGADFSHAVFTAVASFKNANFINEGDVLFYDARFLNKGDVSFNYASFENEGEVSFESARFTNKGFVQFINAKFKNHKTVDFLHVIFSNTRAVTFSRAEFENEGDVRFDFARFENTGNIVFISTEFENEGDVSFSNVTFDCRNKVIFHTVLWINGGSFIFWDVELEDKINAQFHECLFLSHGNISLGGTRFPEKGSLVFQRCHFEPVGNVNFTGAFFRHTMFEGGKVEWISDLLKPSEDEKEAKEKKEVIAKLPVAVKELIKNHEESFHTSVFHGAAVVKFKDLTSESAKHLTFRLTDLSRAKFDGVTLSHIQLNAPTWLKVGLRRMLYEEFEFRESHKKKSLWERFQMYFSKLSDEERMQLKNLENQYTQLKTNLERQGDYYNSGHFHYGEQEMRRKAFYWLGRLFGLTNVYKIFAGYGEKPQTTGLWALAILVNNHRL